MSLRVQTGAVDGADGKRKPEITILVPLDLLNMKISVIYDGLQKMFQAGLLERPDEK